MRNQLATLLKKARQGGVSDGVEFMAGVLLITLNNVADEYIAEEKLGEFFRTTEAEMNRVYSEVMKSVPSGDVDEMAEKIVYHVREIRKKWGMDDAEIL